MLFGTFEIALCLGIVLLAALTAALGLGAQNVLIWWKALRPRCPKCLANVNPEAYICWSCKAELEQAYVDHHELS